MSCKKPNWILLKECGERLSRDGIVPFTRRQLIDCVHEEHPEREEGSLNPIIQGMTVNLKGGAPGSIGKNIFYSVGRGLFECFNQEKHIFLPKENELVQLSERTKYTEDYIRDFLMDILYRRIGLEGTWKGSGKTTSFNLKDEFKGFRCFAERSLPYTLPAGEIISHASDILISNNESGKYISIEIKHRSSVTDQFKCRSYDIFHLKKSYGSNLLGIMVYVKTTTGIRVEHARSLCYFFDHFFGIPFESKDAPVSWDRLLLVVKDFLKS